MKLRALPAIALVVSLLVAGCQANPPSDPALVPVADSGVGAADGGGSAPDAAVPDADGGPEPVDLDGDGLDDAFEAQVAADYLPWLSLDANDGCPRSGIIYRVFPHPQDAALLHVRMVHLFEKDCGLNGHVGDNEMFAFTVDPSKPAPAGITAMIAISHQATACEKTSRCGVCDGLDACETAPGEWPVVYASRGKHAHYVKRSTCNVGFCLDYCAAVSETRTLPPMVNVGEPDAQRVTNLSTQGFITSANGWTEQALFDFNPWAPGKEFGTAGIVADDLVDPAADTAPCRAP